LAIHGVFLVVPEVVVAQLGHGVVLDPQGTFAIIHAGQITIWHLVLVKFAMRAFISTITLAEINIGRCGSSAAGTVVDAERSTLTVTRHNCLKLAVLSDKMLSLGIHGVGAITKVLLCAVYILEVWNAFSSIVTRMFSVVTRFVFLAASEFDRSMPCERSTIAGRLQNIDYRNKEATYRRPAQPV
jgi:hypothetical protein